MNIERLWVINKTFLFILLLIIVFMLGFMISWLYHQSDYLRTGCNQFDKAGFHHITKDSPLYSYSLDQKHDGLDCEGY